MHPHPPWKEEKFAVAVLNKCSKCKCCSCQEHALFSLPSTPSGASHKELMKRETVSKAIEQTLSARSLPRPLVTAESRRNEFRDVHQGVSRLRHLQSIPQLPGKSVSVMEPPIPWSSLGPDLTIFQVRVRSCLWLSWLLSVH